MRSYTVARIWGIPIRINISLLVFLPILAWLIGSGQQIALYVGVVNQFAPTPLDVAVLRAGNTPWVVGVTAAVGLFVGVLLHELGHSWVARRYGLEIESITLWVFGGLARFSAIPREWDREFWIAVAGPVTSVLVGLGCAAVVQLVPSRFPVIVFVFGWLAVVNVTLAAFNLLPAFPMDGGRVLRALLARSRPYGVATRIAARIGVVFALLFAVVGVVGFNPILILVALFVYGAAKSEARVSLLDDLLAGLTVADVMDSSTETLSADDPVSAFVALMLHRRRTAFPVVDGESVVGLVRLSDLRDLSRDQYESVAVADVMGPPPLRVDASADAFDTLAELGQRETDYALVEDGDRIVGTVSQESFLAAIEIQRRLSRTT
ncbi:Zn-dependent protease (includes SpoIVFB) [Halogranum amylolyticum]|uniref:Zinc metalloprotease n=1 Tax=Halogranum amylolyticum TaxID=660520 RepID=A0A1H8MZH2_9EURY|nr:site-2 protease family protein [Halogranum amylolyticum]SEO22663.1 Zn-dependent protease (includes SpoIVFB) [Halogranum amylolyticum]